MVKFGMWEKMEWNILSKKQYISKKKEVVYLKKYLLLEMYNLINE